MSTFRNLTADEVEALKARNHQRRMADTFQCPYCDSITTASTFVVDPAVCVCPTCEHEFFAWAEYGLIHISAKL